MYHESFALPGFHDRPSPRVDWDRVHRDLNAWTDRIVEVLRTGAGPDALAGLEKIESEFNQGEVDVEPMKDSDNPFEWRYDFEEELRRIASDPSRGIAAGWLGHYSRLIEASRYSVAEVRLTRAEFEAMIRLGRSPDRQMSMSDLAGQMVLTSGGVTRLIDRLLKDGYVTRVECPSDRRVQWAQLTDEGVATISQALDTHLEDLDQYFFSAMSPDERKVTVPVLNRLRTTCADNQVAR